MKKANIFTGLRKYSAHVTPFVAIAKRAGKSQVINLGSPPMFEAHDMVNVKRMESICLGQKAIFTSKSGTLGYQRPQAI